MKYENKGYVLGNLLKNVGKNFLKMHFFKKGVRHGNNGICGLQFLCPSAPPQNRYWGSGDIGRRETVVT